MSAQLTFTDTLPRTADTHLITLQKILQRENALSGVSGAAIDFKVLSGSGDPVADPAVTSAVYYDLDTGNIWHWNDSTGTWV